MGTGLIPEAGWLFQLGMKRWGNFVGLAVTPDIQRGLIRFEVAPALERAFGGRLDQRQLRVQHKLARLAAIAVLYDANVCKRLADLYDALDDPVDRAAIKQLVDPFGDHARLMNGLLARPHHALLPRFKVADLFGAHAEFDHVQAHAHEFNGQTQRGQSRPALKAAIGSPAGGG